MSQTVFLVPRFYTKQIIYRYLATQACGAYEGNKQQTEVTKPWNRFKGAKDNKLNFYRKGRALC